MNSKVLELYDIIKEEEIKDLASTGYLLKHKKSGARVLILSNSDDNKVFSIGFRTPPTDDTGVPHILEHSVLCGSDKYNVKDPFVELCKGSLNTFLNAMTYPDKTVYPVASCNIVDFKNIMDVYLDAVFHPNISKIDKIFKQEGWHYEILEEGGPLTINGVVYNEMKGAYSDPDSVLERTVMAALYPDTCYGKESGGEPSAIPELTYENFLAFYNKYYHPCNSYIYMYGDMDIEERLLYIDSEYLSKYEMIDIDSTIKDQEGFASTRELTKSYSITESEANGSNDYLAYGFVTGKSTDRELYIAMEVLDYALLSTPGAPLKQALIDAGIGDEISSSFESGIKQPMFTIIAKNAKAADKERFVSIIKEKLAEIIKSGIDKNSLYAALNNQEFKYREADFGRFPKGLMYGLQSFDSWLYDENEPFMHIAANDTYAFLKKQVETDYYEKLIEKYLLNNTHSTVVVLEAEVGLTAKQDKELADKLETIRSSMSADELERIYRETKELKEYQDEPSSEEALLTIPMLKREDIKREVQPLYNDVKKIDGIEVIHHNIFTNGIGYLELMFDANGVDIKMLPYVGLLNTVLGYVDTKSYSFRELSNEIDMNTGSIDSGNVVIQNSKNMDKVDIKYSVRTKALFDKLPKALSIIEEIIYTSKFDDYKRLKEIILEVKSRFNARLAGQSHVAARMIALSTISESTYYGDILGGYEFYKFVEALEGSFDEKKEEIVANLKSVCETIFNKKNLIVSYTADEDGYKAFEKAFEAFAPCIATKDVNKAVKTFAPKACNLGLTTSSQVNYVCQTGNFIKEGMKYTGALKLLSVILGYDYLWINIRVKGGAYGCMSGFMKNGDAFMVSYRDPKLMETFDVFDGVADYLENFNVSERDMTKFVIGTMGNVDAPLNPSAKGSRSLMAYLADTTIEDMQKERDEMLDVTIDDIKALGKIVRATFEHKAVCVIGNEEKLNEVKEHFEVVKPMFGKEN